MFVEGHGFSRAARRQKMWALAPEDSTGGWPRSPTGVVIFQWHRPAGSSCPNRKNPIIPSSCRCSSSASPTSCRLPRSARLPMALREIMEGPCRNHCRLPIFFHHIFLVRSSQTCTIIGAKIPRRCTMQNCARLQRRTHFSLIVTEESAGRRFSPLFDNIWPQSAPPQVHAKQPKSMLSPIF